MNYQLFFASLPKKYCVILSSRAMSPSMISWSVIILEFEKPMGHQRVDTDKSHDKVRHFD